MEINEVDQQAFIDGSDAIYAKFSEEVDGGKEMLEKVRQLRD